MAITYTYSFNCIIKYRLKGENQNTESPKFNDTSNLVTFTSTESVPTNLELPFPEYISGTENGIKWYEHI